MTVFSNYTLHKRQEIAAKVHAYCRLPAVVLVLFKRRTEGSWSVRMLCCQMFLNQLFITLLTLMRWEILEMWKVSTETTTPSWSRKPATTLGTPGRKDWAHHLRSLNLRSAKIKALASSQPHNMKIMRLYFILYLWKLLRCLGVQISAEVFSST